MSKPDTGSSSRRALRAAMTSIEELTPAAVAALQTAVRVPSVNPAIDERSGGEAACNEVLGDIAAGIGLQVDLWEVAPGRANLAAWAPRSAATEQRGDGLLVGGHIDVVPAGDPDAWTGGDPFSGRLRDGRVWGRGACDMKAGVVAALFAVAALHKAGVTTRRQVIAHSVVGEESGEHELGVDALLARGHGAAAAVIGEPTGDRGPLVPSIATVGWLFCDLEVDGLATHVALRGAIHRQSPSLPPLGVNAVEKAIVVVDHLRALEERWHTTKGHELWQPGDFCIHPGFLHAGPTGSDNPAIYADRARLRCSVLYPPTESAADVRAEVEAHLAELGGTDPWFRDHPVRVGWPLDWPAVEQPVDSPLVRACRAAAGDVAVVTGRKISDEPQAMIGVCDASWLDAAGVAAIACGPGRVADAHAVDESVDVAEFLDAIALYSAQAIRFCGVD